MLGPMLEMVRYAVNPTRPSIKAWEFVSLKLKFDKALAIGASVPLPQETPALP